MLLHNIFENMDFCHHIFTEGVFTLEYESHAMQVTPT